MKVKHVKVTTDDTKVIKKGDCFYPCWKAARKEGKMCNNFYAALNPKGGYDCYWEKDSKLCDRVEGEPHTDLFSSTCVPNPKFVLYRSNTWCHTSAGYVGLVDGADLTTQSCYE